MKPRVDADAKELRNHAAWYGLAGLNVTQKLRMVNDSSTPELLRFMAQRLDHLHIQIATAADGIAELRTLLSLLDTKLYAAEQANKPSPASAAKPKKVRKNK